MLETISTRVREWVKENKEKKYGATEKKVNSRRHRQSIELSGKLRKDWFISTKTGKDQLIWT